jgi:hypothetical protein
VLGLLFGIAFVLLLSWMEADLLRTPLAVERSLGLAVLGTIPASAGARDVTTPATSPGRMALPKTV